MKRTFCLLCTLLFSLAVYGQSGRLFTTDRELSSSLINTIYQDRNGMIWVATEDGLNRYDGAKFTIYRNIPGDETSLVHNYVRSLFEDNQGRLYIGTYSGVQIYNPATDNFSAPARLEDGSLCNYFFVSFMQRANGEVWASGTALCTLTVDDNNITVHPASVPINISRTDYILEDMSGNLWCTRGQEGICCITPDNKIDYYLKSERGMIVDICEDRSGNLYVASLISGIYKFNKQSNQFELIPYPSKRPLPVKDIYCNNHNQLYLGTDGMGMKVYNIREEQITDYVIDDTHFNSNTAKVHCVLRDREGNLWAAIYQKGVLMLPALPNSFKYLGYQSVDKNIIGSNCITAFCIDHTGTVWVGTDNDGIYSLTPNLEGKNHYAAGIGSRGVPSTIMGLYEDAHHQLWVGSYLQGMGRLDPQTGVFTPQTDLVDNDGNPVTRVYDFAQDANDRLWIGTMGSGLYYYDYRTQRVYKHSQANQNVDAWITCLLYGQNNKLFVGTYHGINCIDLGQPGEGNLQIMPHVIAHCLYQTADGIVWIGTSEGLLRWDTTTSETATFAAKDGLPGSAVYAIQGDNRDFLWLSTNSGLAQFSLLTHKCINYYVSDGLQGNEFSKNASYKDAQDRLWFGGMNGITYFHPVEITNPARKWNVRITNFYLHNQPVHKNTLSGRHQVIDRPVFEATHFYLSRKDNTFSIEFATQELANSERITYQYTLNDDRWISLPQGVNLVSFSNLPPNHYHFKLRATDNTITSAVKEVTLRIYPAWWETLFAKICYFLLGGCILLIINLYVRNSYRTKQEILQHAHKEQLNESKFQFFTNISHEIRSPMSLIISPLHQLIENDADPVRQKSYRTIYRNAQRILMLVNQLMDIRKIDQGQFNLHFRKMDIVGVLSDLRDTFAQEATIRHIFLSFLPSVDELPVWLDSANFDKIIFNLLSNAFKFTAENGSITLSLDTGNDPQAPAPLQQYVQITIADTGVGIPPEERELIFERFYQIRNSQNNSNVGTGIGLHLVRSLVAMHYGDIHVYDNPDGATGSRFVIRLPLGNAHLRADQMETSTQLPPVIGRGTLQSYTMSTPLFPTETPKGHPRTKFRVLVAEDDAEIRRYVCQELSGDYHMSECTNGEEALQMVFSQKPDLVISDVMMPKMDGLELCSKIKQNVTLNYLPIILLTAKTKEEDTVEGLECGADAYLTKPFSIEVLQKTVENLLTGREKLRNAFSGKQLQEDKLDKIEVLSPDDQLLERVLRVINQNLSNTQLTVESVADQVGISRVHLHRKLKELTNQTSRDFIRNIRLKQAATLLSQKRYSIAQVAEEVGFSNPNNFSTAFKELYGTSPTAYMEDHLSK